MIEASTGTGDWWVFWIVAAARFLLPLTIPRYPVPGIVASLLLDGVDQTIFQQFTGLRLDFYQGYDKALDIYYLSIAYISTLRNWANLTAFRLSRFLFYWRLAGVAAFELTGLRPLLLIFPNTFEYFYIFYEAYRLRWDPRRMTARFLLGVAALIWIVIKLPQEYWIHIARGDTTDWVKASVFRSSAETPWSEIARTWPWLLIGVVLGMAAILVAAVWLARRRMRPAERSLAFSADAHQPKFTEEQVQMAVVDEARRIVDLALVEKLGLVTLVSISFAQVLPDVQASSLETALGVALVVAINTVLSHVLARRGFGWAFSLRQLAVLGAVNLGVFVAYALLRSRSGSPVGLRSSVFFAVLTTLLVVLYDRYRQVSLMRQRIGPQGQEV